MCDSSKALKSVVEYGSHCRLWCAGIPFLCAVVFFFSLLEQVPRIVSFTSFFLNTHRKPKVTLADNNETYKKAGDYFLE